MTSSNTPEATALVIGGGPAGLMAAETLALAGVQVEVYDAMPSVGRKFLLAGKGGMNLTHAEARADFVGRYGQCREPVAQWLNGFGPEDLRVWAQGLGIETFVGSSGRVFPLDMKAAPLLRAWLHRLRQMGVRFHMRSRWLGWAESGHAIRFATPAGEHIVRADTIILALGGASWPHLGSDAAWVPILAECAVNIARMQAANCGFDVAWSTHFQSRFAGHALKTVAITCAGLDGPPRTQRGEFVISAHGVEGSLIYALSASLREAITVHGSTILHLDLLPDWTAERVCAEVARPRGARSLASHLQSRLGLKGVKVGLLRECLSAEAMADPLRLGVAIKALPIHLPAPRPIAEAISTAGGVRLEALDEHLMLRALPGVFCAGEMLDWEAPTGGYLLTACFASGRVAGQGAVEWLNAQTS